MTPINQPYEKSDPYPVRSGESGRDLSLAARGLPTFAIFAGLGYFICMGFTISPFAYYPKVGEFHVPAQPETLGPPMYWYGWILCGIAAGAVAAATACMLPRPIGAALANRLSWLLWAVPVSILLATLYFLRHFFL